MNPARWPLIPPKCLDRRHWALFLDIDGSLVDIAARPEDVVVPVTLVPILTELHEAFDGAVALITGRTIADADRLLAPLRLPAAGVHGAEFRRDGNQSISKMSASVPRDLQAAIAALCNSFPGVRYENKLAAVTVHFRSAAHAGGDLLKFLAEIVSEFPGFTITAGRMAFEVHRGAFNKHAALLSFCQTAPFADRRPVMIGDDSMDEAAFTAATSLGGLGLSVAGEYFGSQATFASSAEVRCWLAALPHLSARSNARGISTKR